MLVSAEEKYIINNLAEEMRNNSLRCTFRIPIYYSGKSSALSTKKKTHLPYSHLILPKESQQKSKAITC